MLSASDTLPARPRRVVVAGVSGVGKTTFARRLAPLLDSRHIELDGLFHGPGWTPRPAFLADVRALVAGDTWVTEWNYGPARALVAESADLMVWLDLPFRVTLARVVRRTVRRRISREVLWNGNREGPLRHVLTDPAHVVRWSISTRHAYAERVPRAEADHPGLLVVRLRSARETEQWLDALASRRPGAPGPRR